MAARYVFAGLCALFFAFPLIASAAVNPTAPTNCAPATNSSGACTANSPCTAAGKIITFYVPHGGSNCSTSIEGCIETSRLSLKGTCEPMTVDAVRLGQDTYVTCASDPSNYGKYFNIGTVTYRSALDMQMHTVPNVTCFVHDTGGAFRGRPDKLDVAITVCGTCTDPQAGALANGSKVNILGGGTPDATTNIPTNNPWSGGSVPYTTNTAAPPVTPQQPLQSSQPISSSPTVTPSTPLSVAPTSPTLQTSPALPIQLPTLTPNTTATSAAQLLQALANPTSVATTVGTATPLALNTGANNIAQTQNTSQGVNYAPPVATGSIASVNPTNPPGQSTFTSSDLSAVPSSYVPQSSSLLIQLLNGLKATLIGLLHYL